MTSPSPPTATIRDTIRPSDLAAVRDIVASSGFFYDHEIDIAVELAHAALTQGAGASGYHFLFLDDPEAPSPVAPPIAYACYGPIPCADGSWDLYWIAAHAARRARGYGRLLLRAAESRMAAAGARRIYIETSSRPLYDPTRAFYAACGYTVEARLRDFYAPGDDKLIYSRSLTGALRSARSTSAGRSASPNR